MVKILVDVVASSFEMTLNEIDKLSSGNLQKIEELPSSSVLLKSGNQILATGQLIRSDDQLFVSILNVNNTAFEDNLHRYQRVETEEDPENNRNY